MTYPRILINLNKIKENTEKVVSVCAPLGIEVIGVTKACLGDPAVGRAMLDGGASGLGDSRTENLRRLREAGFTGSLMMLRLPMKSEAEEIVQVSDCSLNSDSSVLEALAREAVKAGREHTVILMVDTGDGREGVRYVDAVAMARKAAALAGIRVAGFGTNVACLAGAEPTPDQMNTLVGLARKAFSGDKAVVSGGNSSAWSLVREGSVPAGVNQLRFGELILLGRETARGEFIEGLHRDAFIIEAEIVESIPARGEHHIAALGRQDVDAADLYPLDPGWLVVKASSDHLVLKKAGAPGRVGESVGFRPGYDALLRAMTSPFVAKKYV